MDLEGESDELLCGELVKSTGDEMSSFISDELSAGGQGEGRTL